MKSIFDTIIECLSVFKFIDNPRTDESTPIYVFVVSGVFILMALIRIINRQFGVEALGMKAAGDFVDTCYPSINYENNKKSFTGIDMLLGWIDLIGLMLLPFVAYYVNVKFTHKLSIVVVVLMQICTNFVMFINNRITVNPESIFYNKKPMGIILNTILALFTAFSPFALLLVSFALPTVPITSTI